MAGHVFISYSRTDRAYVDKLAAYLTAAGMPVWYDYQVATGERFDKVIKAQVDACSAFVVVMTPAADESEWVAIEVTYAKARGKPILPLLLAGEVFMSLNVRNYEDVTGGRMPSRRFVDRVGSLVAQAAPAPPSSARTPQASHRASAKGKSPPSPPLRSSLTGGPPSTGRPAHARTRWARILAAALGVILVVSGAYAIRVIWPRGAATIPFLPATATIEVGGAYAVAFSPDGETLAAAGSGATTLWNVANLDNPTQTATLTDTSVAMAFSPDGDTLATEPFPLFNGLMVTLWNVADRAHPRVASMFDVGTKEENSLARALAFSVDGHTLAIAFNNTVELWNVASAARPTLAATLTIDTRRIVQALAFSPDGHTLATVTDYYEPVKLWDVTNPADPTFAGTLDGFYAVTFSPDGDYLATRGSHGTALLWSVVDRAHPTLTATIAIGGGYDVGDPVAFGVDGKILITAGSNVTMWDVANPARPTPMAYIDDSGRRVIALSPNGKILAIGNSYNIGLWRLTRPSEVTVTP